MVSWPAVVGACSRNSHFRRSSGGIADLIQHSGMPMSIRRSVAVVAALVAVVLVCGCATPWNDRFYVPGRDPLLTLMGAEWGDSREWPPARLPYLPPMRTELIPDRSGPGAEPLRGGPPNAWPPL
jgi:hypothetical protein